MTRRDVEARLGVLGSRPTDVPADQSSPQATPTRPVGEHTDLPHSGMRVAIASRLTESKQTTPHFYVRGTARVDRLLKLRAKLNKDADVKVSVNDLVVKAVARAHVLVPRLNVIWTDDAIRQFGSVDVAVAVATEDGLLAPVLRGVEQQSLSAVAAAVRDIAERARTKRLRQDELEGGTVTVTNLGMYGTEEFSAIINPPHSAILAVGAAREEPVVRKRSVWGRSCGSPSPSTIARSTGPPPPSG